MTMDWQAWKTALELWLKTPELIAATILVVIAAFGLGWKARSHTAKEREGTLRDTNASLGRELHDCREDLRDVKGELRETVRRAEDNQRGITKEVEALTRENSELRSRIKDLENKIAAGQLPTTPAQVIWVREVHYLADRSDTIGRHLTALSTANTALEGTLSDISKKLELTEPSDNGKRRKQ